MVPPSDPSNPGSPERSQYPTESAPWSPQGSSGSPYEAQQQQQPYPTQPYSGAPYGGQQQYGGQSYGGQQYGGQQQYGSSYPGQQQYQGGQQYPGSPYPGQQQYPPGPPPGGPRKNSGWIVAIVAVVVLVLVGGGTGAYFLLRSPSTPTPSPTPIASPTPSLAPTTASTTPPLPTTTVPPASGSTITQAFPLSAGSSCIPYTPKSGEYVPPSGGQQAQEVRVCVSGANNDEGVVYARWGSSRDAQTWVTDQSSSTTSVDGKTTWTQGGSTQGDYHQTRSSTDCRIILDYTASPYALVFLAPTCSEVGSLFQRTSLPDNSTLPR